MQTAYRLKDYLLCVQRLAPLDEVELALAWEGWARGEERARRLIEERFLGRVVAWVLPYRGNGLSLLGLIETGNRALLKALRHQPVCPPEGLEEHLRLAVEEEVEGVIMARRPG